MHHTQIWILVKKIMTYEDVTLLPATKKQKRPFVSALPEKGKLDGEYEGPEYYLNAKPITFTMKKTEKKNPKKIKLSTSNSSLHKAGRNSFGRIFLFRRMVRTAERAMVKLATLALTAKIIRGSVIFIKEQPQIINPSSKR